MIYLDYNATTPVRREAVESMMPWFGAEFANPSAGYREANRARNAVEDSREKVAESIGARPREIIFTSGGTESDNLAIKGAVLSAWLKNRSAGGPPPHVITSTAEHKAVLSSCKQLELIGCSVTYVPVDGSCRVSVSEVEAAIRPETALISIHHANNETGVIQPVAELARIARAKGVTFHTDAVQSFGKIPLAIAECGADLISLSAHKVYGPKGVGALYLRQGISLEPLQTGGSHEMGLRAGTSNVPGIVGFGVAAELAARDIARYAVHTSALARRLEAGLGNIHGASINGAGAERLPNTVNVSFNGVSAETLLINLDLAGISASSGSACGSGAMEPSHVLRAMGLPAERVRGSVRFSLGMGSSPGEIDLLISMLMEKVPVSR